MNALPDSFQFRVSEFPGLTHTAKRNAHGDYEIKWSRGFFEALINAGRSITNFKTRVVDDVHLTEWFSTGQFILVEDSPKIDELPDEFLVGLKGRSPHWLMKRDGDLWYAHFHNGKSMFSEGYSAQWLHNTLKGGTWKILDKPPLTAEQQKSIELLQQRVMAVDSSIKMNEQSMEHLVRMVANYQSTKDELLEQIAEIKGEESPKVAKAKVIKGELDKLKGNA